MQHSWAISSKRPSLFKAPVPDHIQPIVQPELFAEFPSDLGEPEGEEPESEEVSLAVMAYLTRVTALATRLDQMDHRLNRIEKGIARIEQQWGEASPAQQAED